MNLDVTKFNTRSVSTLTFITEKEKEKKSDINDILKR